MEANEYQNLAMRMRDRSLTLKAAEWLITRRKYDRGGILDGCMGLAVKSGDFCNRIKAWCFQGEEFDEEKTKEELGHVLWYVAQLAESFGWGIWELMVMNLETMKKQYFEKSENADEMGGDGLSTL